MCHTQHRPHPVKIPKVDDDKQSEQEADDAGIVQELHLQRLNRMVKGCEQS